MKSPEQDRMVKNPRIALLGNPNSGKSTLFNRMTGLRQRIANYPGITVEKKTGMLPMGSGVAEVIDLPGTYSLAATSPDEQIVMDVLGGRCGQDAPDVLLFVADATNLRRNLFLAAQAAELGIPMVVALNHWDAAQRNGLRIDVDALSARLGVPVIPTNARDGKGVETLIATLTASMDDPRRFMRVDWPQTVADARTLVLERVCATGQDLTPAEALRVVFDANSQVAARLEDLPDLKEWLRMARGMIRQGGLNPGPAEAILVCRHLDKLLEGIIQGDGRVARTTESIDGILLHRFWGSLIFIFVMNIVFQAIYAGAGPLMDGIEAATGWTQSLAGPWFAGMPALQSLMVDGVIGGVGGVVIFLPQILLLFFFISLLEESGYLARAAFLMDKVFGWSGLNGKSFVPLLSGFACAIPGVMAARTLEDPKVRITTILMTPLMSCSARLPVYVLLIGAFIEPAYGPVVAGWSLFAMHLVGVMVALPFAWVMNRWILKTSPQPFILEMPEYRVPLWRNLLIRMWERGREFVIRAGTVILAFSIIIWAALYFPRSGDLEESTRATLAAEHTKELGAEGVESALADPQSELSVELDRRLASARIADSYLGRLGKTVQPVFEPAGFDWKITVGVLSSFPAREVIIATLGILYNLGAEVDEESSDLRDVLAAERWESGPRTGQPVFTIPTVVSLMVFFALCAQCGATVAVIARQLNWRWAAASFLGMTTAAWVGAVLVQQVSTFFLSAA